MPKVAIVAALEREVRALVKNWRASDREYDGLRFRFFENHDVVLVCGGIGALGARRAAEAVISLFDPEVVYSAGFAGALDPKLKVGEVVRPAVVINAGDCSRVQLRGGEGVLVSFGSVASPAQKASLREAFGADFVDMEAAVVARAAEARGVAFAAVKSISDESDFQFPETERFVDENGRFSEIGFALFAALRPWLWPRVVRLARNSARASRTLCAHLARLSEADLLSSSKPQQKREVDEARQK